MDDVRRRLAVLIVAALGVLAVVQPATASAKGGAKPAVAAPPTNQCIVHSLPAFMDQGIEKDASSVADIVEVECDPFEYDGKVKISDVELYDRCGRNMSWSPTYEFKSTVGPSTEAQLDDDGNATVVLWAGPECKPGESQVVVDEVAYPNETYMTPFSVLPPEETPEGVFALPSRQVEDEIHSSVATILEVEFPAVAEHKVAIDAEQMYDRCGKGPHAIWIGPNEEPIKAEGRLEGESAIETDDDGNAFVVLLGARSCQPGKVVIAASLEESPFTTVDTTFTIESPRPTVEEAFTVEKEQKIGAGGYTKAKVHGKPGEVVDYKIIVTNTGGEVLDLSSITDPNCTNIKGPSKAELAPGEQAEYTCEHELGAEGTWVNVATVETSTHRTEKSNEVEAEVEVPNFVVEKEQKVGAGLYTKEKLVAKVGEVVRYRIVVTNTGNTSITLANITDPNCGAMMGPSQSTLAPKEHAEYTCEHELTSEGAWHNVATVEDTGGLHKESNEVEVEAKAPLLKVEKEQQIGAGSYTRERIEGKLGEVVHYKIIVTNNGAVAVTLRAISDPNCENMSAPTKSTLGPGESAEYTCEHALTSVGVWLNTAEVETTTHVVAKSNTVEAEVPEPGAPEEFSVVKEQRLATGSYTTSRLVGKVGETVFYLIKVTNTGKSQVHLTAISDPNCTNIVGPGKAELGLGESTEYTCEHTLTGTQPWINVATVESTHVSEKSNQVESEATEFAPVQELTVEKEQRIGAGAYTKTRLSGKPGEVIYYRIVVTNTGNVATTPNVSDPGCTNLKAVGKTELQPTESAEYTCEHAIAAESSWTNLAKAETPGGKSTPSNEVEAVVAKQAEKGVCTLEASKITLAGGSGVKRKPFKVSISAVGIAKALFYIDGRHIKTLKASQARHGRFTITIDPGKLGHGGHKIVVKADPVNTLCKTIARTAVFVHPKSSHVAPAFTG